MRAITFTVAAVLATGASAYSGQTTRRKALIQSTGALFGITAASAPIPAYAKPAYPEEESDKKKIVAGYKRLEYLLANWEKETTVCGRYDNPYIGDGKGCERTPERVMEYLGYKSTNDPLFRVDKTLKRLERTTDDPEFLDLLEKFLEQADESNVMAFTSSWGEANPGGGKDRVEYFIERSKKNVIEARDDLKAVVRILDLQVD
mmetsp:Transcript_1836/g.4869  ORF Transcript_1836/g.4869 Transcript_1836/m.4869 type:complete len:204 (-) Transcript_1836:365-976(-)|eukprot:CAMPEP_0113544120 /NCGR_PEP_ID=MMETSP0015_2-20120614/10537_1 /TAXON_ID=2838 /ORGANISM="Odontella" /LENGTH=203 /DNA_ID=CAMNT_0000444355 /DNA_START=162 /DNA_END=773 /DNA_ORIENTATION=- /assembly_acc=CAM_ASM_000160